MTEVVQLSSRDEWRIRCCTSLYLKRFHLFGPQYKIISCSDPGPCPLCMCNNDTKTKHLISSDRAWYIGIIDRLTNRYLIVSMGDAILCSMSRLEQSIGDPKEYDTELVRTMMVGWSAIAIPQELSDDDKGVIASIDQSELDALTTPTQSDIERLNKISLLL